VAMAQLYEPKHEPTKKLLADGVFQRAKTRSI
jgi:hypothetical protein